MILPVQIIKLFFEVLKISFEAIDLFILHQHDIFPHLYLLFALRAKITGFHNFLA